MIAHIKLTRQEDICILSDWSKKIGKTNTKSVILAIQLAEKYQQLELENRALKIALANTQTPLDIKELINNK